MADLHCRLPEALDAKFAALAASYGGKSTLMRRLVEQVVGEAGPGPGPVKPASNSRSTAELRLRLTVEEREELNALAHEAGVRPIQWAETVLRVRLGGTRRLSRPQHLAVNEVRDEVRAIGRNLNQMARAMNVAVMEGRVTEMEVAEVERFEREMRDLSKGLIGALRGMLTYWEADEA